MAGITYLASPYSSPDPQVREIRYQIACRVAARLMTAGEVVFCPIAHSHPIAQELDPALVCAFEFWMRQDLPILAACSKLVVLRMRGWDKSLGIKREIEFATERGISTEYIDQ